jgi:hypothetical protein
VSWSIAVSTACYCSLNWHGMMLTLSVWLQVSFNLPEPPRKPKGGSPASFYFTSISPKKVFAAICPVPSMQRRSLVCALHRGTCC